MGKKILVISIVIVLAGAAGAGGYVVGDRAGFERANAVRQEFFQPPPGMADQSPPGQMQRGGGPDSRGAGPAQGTIKSVGGDTVTVALGAREVKVKLSERTQIIQSAPGSRADLAAGANVWVTLGGGEGNALEATAIIILP